MRELEASKLRASMRHSINSSRYPNSEVFYPPPVNKVRDNSSHYENLKGIIENFMRKQKLYESKNGGNPFTSRQQRAIQSHFKSLMNRNDESLTEKQRKEL